MTDIKFKRTNPNEAYKKRVSNAKTKLPTNWRDIIISNYPEYGSAKGYVLLSNVYTGRSADMNITEYIEKIVTGELQLKEDNNVQG